MRLGWFSPFPPVRTGIAACSAELVEALRRRGHDIDLYPEAAAHDFVWRHRLDPYDLVVYQFGNSSHHDYAWAYALKYPGLAVLHDTHLHHARAAYLLRENRAADYRAEFRWNHPDVPADVAELAVAGFDSRLYYDWPMVRSLVEASRLVAVHGEGARRELEPNARGDLSGRIVSMRLGHGQLVSPQRELEARRRVRSQYAIAEEAVLFGVFGGLTPEKRLPQILAAFRALLPHAPTARLLLAGASAPYYDIAADIARRGLADHVTLTGYLDTDESLTRSPRRLRRDAEPALADRARNVRSLAPRPRRRPGDVRSRTSSISRMCLRWIRGRGRCRMPGIGDRGSGRPRGSASALSTDPRSPVPDLRLRRHRHPRRGSLLAPRDATPGRRCGAARATRRRGA
jgi:glycosyltransferase involved in cell wall biosynthesis